MSQRKKEQKGQPHYPVEVKDLAVSRLRAGESVATIASEVGCGVGRIYYWRDRWEKTGRQWPELGARDRSSRSPPAIGSPEREAALERLVGQQQAELDFLREALRLMKQVRRPTAEAAAPSPTSSSRAGRLSRKAD
jgi:transposase-like protein